MQWLDQRLNVLLETNSDEFGWVIDIGTKNQINLDHFQLVNIYLLFTRPILSRRIAVIDL